MTIIADTFIRLQDSNYSSGKNVCTYTDFTMTSSFGNATIEFSTMMMMSGDYAI